MLTQTHSASPGGELTLHEIRVESKKDAESINMAQFLPGTFRTYNRDFLFRDELSLQNWLIFNKEKDLLYQHPS